MSAGERLPGTPEPMHRWTSEDGVEIAGDTWENQVDLSLCCSTVAAKHGMLGKAPAKPWAPRVTTSLRLMREVTAIRAGRRLTRTPWITWWPT